MPGKLSKYAVLLLKKKYEQQLSFRRARTNRVNGPVFI